MKKKILALIIGVFSTLAGAATLNPIQLLNPAGSTAGQVIVSTGPSSAPSWSANFGPLNFAATGNFYQGQGGNVSRINDRLFVSAATANNGTQVASQPDWLTQFQLSIGRTGGFIQLSNFAVLNGSNPQNQDTMVVGVQSSTNTLSGGGIGAVTMGVNNNTSVAGNVWASYNEAYRMSGVSGGAYGFEIDTVNYASDTVTDPYQQASAQVIGLQLAAGAELSPTGQFPSQAAINIQNNHSTFDTGIVFGSNSLTSGLAIAFSSGQRLQWFGSAGVPTSSVLSTGTTQAAGLQQKFSDNSVSFNNASSAAIFQAFGVSSGVNGIQAVGASAGNPVQLQAIGSDTNIPIQLNGKGTAGAQIQGFTDGSSAPAGKLGEYVTNTTSGVSLTTGTTANITSISLTAGDWDVSGSVNFVPAATTTVSYVQAGTNTTSATQGGLGTYTLLQATFTAGQVQGMFAPTQRISLSATTTVYLVGTATFGTSTMTANGFIRARRVR